MVFSALGSRVFDAIVIDGPGVAAPRTFPPLGSYRAGAPAALAPSPSPVFGDRIDRNLSTQIPWPSQSN